MKIYNQLYKKLICSLKLGDGWFNKSKLIFAFIKFPLLRRLGVNFSLVKLKLKKFGQSFYFYATDGSDLSILQEIFINNEYEINIAREPKIIFDLGSNVGLSVLFFKLKYPDVKIYAFEPDPGTFKKMVKNTEQFTDIYCSNIAVSEKDGRQKFFIYPDSSMSSSLVERVANEPFIEVTTKTLDTLMKDLDLDHIDLLKFDVEGAEYLALKDFKNITKVNEVVGEIHLDLMSGVSRESFLQLFSDFDFSCYDISPKRFILRGSLKNQQ